MLPEPRRKTVVDYFIRNYFNFITNGDIKDHTLKRFISDQQLYLQQTVQNISDATSAAKPPVKKEVPPHDPLADYYSIITKLFTLWPKKDYHKNEHHDQIVEEIKVRLNQMLDDIPQNIKEEFKGMLNFQRQSFYIENSSNCEPKELKFENKQQSDNQECNSE